VNDLPRAQPLSDSVAFWIGETQGGRAVEAIAALYSLVESEGDYLSQDELRKLARIDAYSLEHPGPASHGIAEYAAVNAAMLHYAVERVMRRRGMWRRFRRAERMALAVSAAGCAFSLLFLAVALLTLVFFVLLALNWIVSWFS